VAERGLPGGIEIKIREVMRVRLLTIIFIIPVILISQEFVDDVIYPEEIVELDYSFEPLREEYFVRTKIHFVRPEGSTPLEHYLVKGYLDIIYRGVEYFYLENQTDIYFVFDEEYNEIQSDSYYDFDTSQDLSLFANDESNQLNIYFVGTAAINGLAVGGIGWYQDNHLVIIYNASPKIVAHEIGHCFNLYHTFEGNDNLNTREKVIRPWDSYDPDCEPNCESGYVGDRLCDTNADLKIFHEGDNEEDTQCDGYFYDPPMSNLMSYHPNIFHFTEGQINRMKICLDGLLYEILTNPSLPETSILFNINDIENNNELTNESVLLYGYSFDNTGTVVDHSTNLPLLEGISYHSKTNFNNEELFFSNWNDFIKPNIYSDYYFTVNDLAENEVIAKYKEKYLASITSNYEFANQYIKIKDPWYHDDVGSQNNTFIPLSEWDDMVFLNEFYILENPQYPNYTLKTEKYIVYDNGIYEFLNWSYNSQSVYVLEDNNPTTPLIFLSSNASVQAVYSRVDIVANHSINITSQHQLNIPEGTILNLAENFQINILPTGSVIIPNCTFNYRGNEALFTIIRDSNTERKKIIFDKVIFYTDEIESLIPGIDIQIVDGSSAPWDIIISNCDFVNSGYVVSLSDNLTTREYISINNTIFFDSVIEPINDYDNICFNNFYNTETNIITLCDQPDGTIYFDPLFFNPLNNDYSLQYNSPCIDSGDPEKLDPDGTQIDIGAFYFNQLLGDVNSDGEINILDIPIFVNYILGNPNSNFQFHVFDLNQDGIINITDVLALINIILGNDSIVNNSTITYLSGIIEAIEDGQRYKYSIDMLNEQDVYILHFKLQFNNKIPLNVIKGSRSNNMTITHVYKEEDNTLNIMIYSPEGRKIPQGYGTILEIELESTGLGRDGDLTDGSEFIITDLANNPETLIPVEIVSADELYRLSELQTSLLPTEYNLHLAYPNPFNPITNITYELPEESHVLLIVYNINGRLVETLINYNQLAGVYSIDWNAEYLPSGAYFIKLFTGEFEQIQKVILLK
jgi:hypothetical protein